MLIELKEDNLNEIIQNNPRVFVQYSAGWCGNCRIMKPKFKRMSSEDGMAEYVIVDAEKFPESRKLANVNNLPTFAAFTDGQLVDQVQTNKVDVLKSFIHEAATH